MQLDHVSFASGPDGYEAAAERIADALKITPYNGGVHPRFGTRNLIFPLTGEHYLEVVEPLEHPAALSTPFGQAVRARSELGGGWMGWCVRVDDLDPIEERLERRAVDGNRTPEGADELLWKQIGIKGLIADPQLPFFIHWISPRAQHPSQRPAEQPVSIASLQIAGSRERLREWLDTDDPKPIPEVGIDWDAPNGIPGLMSVTFETPQGTVVI
ncbi:VOC family protein [Brevibacterium sp. 5221]|uniref:VOC family protein n=1 Tax=Brevibacterium rongguiense TaxID=2695267 RepID=A0A6N9H8Q2_9MICO|nr:VOC family protein [Brevibacterium rongguiense]MYM20399.1 VOC family protein [Brevibacterium rongguiense]